MKKIIFSLFCLIISSQLLAEELHLNSETSFVPDFKNRFSFLAGFNPSVTRTNEIKNFHFAYGSHVEENRWWDFNFTLTKGLINKLTYNNASATTLTNDQFSDYNDSTQMSLGMGVLYETRYIQTLLPFVDTYELMSASLTYNIFKNNLSGKTFNGPGLIAKCSVLKKFNDFISIGGNFIYNLAVVKRSQLNDAENSSSRSLTLTHLTLGFDLSLFL
jgi:hypothetical protein